MLKIGLTGGIGSGKSTVGHIFEVLGVPVYYADVAAKRVMNDNAELKSAITGAFGDGAYQDGHLNRAYLAGAVFNDTEKIQILNSLVHPVTIRDAADWFGQQRAPYAVKEAALIFESGADKMLDYVIGVSSPESLRIQRAMERDKISADAVMSRMQQQLNEPEKLRLCHYIIFNDERQMVIPQVLALHDKLIAMASQPAGPSVQ